MKKVIIFGSTSTIGQHLVKQAIKLGHQVTAFTRNKDKVDYKHERLKIIEGNVLDYTHVEKAIENNEIVLCSLGAGRKGGVR